MLWWLPALALLAGGTAVWYSLGAHRKRLQVWQEAVIASGLSVAEVSSLDAKLVARAGPVGIQIEARRQGIRLQVLIPGPPGFAGMRLRRERHKPSGAREIELGDEEFDRLFFVEGPPRVVSAMLDVEARRLFTEVSRVSETEVLGGALRTDIPEHQLAHVLPVLLVLAERWAGRPDLARRLADNARQDPEAGVRLSNLLLLIREFPSHPKTAEVLHTALGDPSPRVRVRAAMELGAAGRDVLFALAADPEDDAASAQAVTLLGRELRFETARDTLIHALRRRHLQTAGACLESLGRSGSPLSVEILTQMMTRERRELAARAALALGSTGDPAAEPPLLRTLQGDQPEVRLAAAQALGRVGTAAAVLPLREAAELDDRDVRRAARQAIGEIQSRLQGAAPGQLSLAQSEAGQLSLASDPAGQLSLPPERARS